MGLAGLDDLLLGGGIMIEIAGEMRPCSEAAPGPVLDLDVVGQVADLQCLVKGKGDTGIGCARAMTLAAGKVLGCAREELLNLRFGKGGHDSIQLQNGRGLWL